MNGQNRSVKGKGVATLIGLLTVCTLSTGQPRLAGATTGCTVGNPGDRANRYLDHICDASIQSGQLLRRVR